MARRDRPAGGGAELRGYLLADAREFREQMARIDPESWPELSKPVDQLAAGEPFRLHGWQLPEHPEHPGRKVFGLNADLLLTGDDELVRAAESLVH